MHAPTFEVERLVPPWVERPPLDLGLQTVFLVRQEGHAHVRVTQTIRVLGCQVPGLEKNIDIKLRQAIVRHKLSHSKLKGPDSQIFLFLPMRVLTYNVGFFGT